MKQILAIGIGLSLACTAFPHPAHAVQACSVFMYTPDQMKKHGLRNHTFGEADKTILATRGQTFGSKKITASQTCRFCEREGISVGVKQCQAAKGRYFGYSIQCTKNGGKSKTTGRGAGLAKAAGRECPKV